MNWSNSDSFNRRNFLKKTAAAGVAGTGLLAGTGTTSAATDCMYIIVEGKEGTTDYTIDLESWDEPVEDWKTESSDNVYGNTIDGQISAGNRDRYRYDGSDFKNINIDGGDTVIYTYHDCGPSTGEYPPSCQIDISGVGDYTIGMYDEEDLTGKNLESGDVESCFPYASDTGDLQLKCTFDNEGVFTYDVHYKDENTTREHAFGTGQVKGYQYKDTFEAAAGLGGGAPNYLRLKGDLQVDITED